ncbi:hypothetical protein A4A49_54508 [Nicotiana attenuata]|uniref:Uncharacterized protein n=1 Tax=Nicotiana attenuata TaxID=49451 RepID=A0A1J6JQX2_NICAT|nr:hypothetical protein A4A49_54508 [Nicotiana attenuata]
MGLNEIYEQSRSQIMMTSPTSSIDKAYSMLVERESQRTVANTIIAGDVNKPVALLAGFKGKRKINMNTACNVCADNTNPNIGTGNTGNTGQIDGCNKREMARALQLTA